MVWNKLKIGLYEIKYSVIKADEKEFPLCDVSGKPLTRVSGTYTKGYFVDETGNKLDTAFRLIKGKPFAKLERTKEIGNGNYKEVDVREVNDLVVEKQYLVVSDLLLRDLIDTGKALKFGITFGGGFKVYIGYIYPSLYEGFLEMAVGSIQKSQVIMEMIKQLKQEKKSKQVEIQIKGIDKAKVEDLIQI